MAPVLHRWSLVSGLEARRLRCTLLALFAMAACSSEEGAAPWSPQKDSGADSGGDSGSSQTCAAKTCSQLGAECGTAPNGCGGILDCGSCGTGLFCGGNGPNRCGANPCTPTSCSALGLSCDVHSDGCGATLSCGECTAPETCGGGGSPWVCGCSPTSCAAQKAECGSIPDGCGGTLHCGSCGSGSCQNGQCVCSPTSCKAAGFDCGSIPDGCGATLNCGNCSSPKQCGASGTPGVCGCNPTICPPFYTNSFESGSDFPGAWTAWHNCAQDTTWSVKAEPYPAPGGGGSDLRLHTTGFVSGCQWPGAYAQSPSLPAQPGRTYRIESWCRNGGAQCAGSLIFFDAAGKELQIDHQSWAGDAWQYHANPPTKGTAPANASYLQVRIELTTPAAYLDVDLLEVYLEP